MTKHALLGLSRSLFDDARSSGVKVYNISPGSMKTDMVKCDMRQDFNTFLEVEEVAQYIIDVIQYDSNLISEEVRINRMVVK
jgi:short-subunit dehydrogenase